MTHEEASAGPARRGGTRHERGHHREQGKVGKKGMAGIFGDKFGSRWDGGGLVRVGSLVEKTTTLSWATRHLFASIVCLLFWDSIETNH